MRGLQELSNVEGLLQGFRISKTGLVIESDFVNSYLELGMLGLMIFILCYCLLFFSSFFYVRCRQKGI